MSELRKVKITDYKGEEHQIIVTERWEKLGLLENVDNVELKNKIANYYEDALQYFLGKQIDVGTSVFPIIRRIFTGKDESGIAPIIKDFDVIELINRILEIWKTIYPSFIENFNNYEYYDAEAEFTLFISNLLQREYKINDKK